VIPVDGSMKKRSVGKFRNRSQEEKAISGPGVDADVTPAQASIPEQCRESGTTTRSGRKQQLLPRESRKRGLGTNANALALMTVHGRKISHKFHENRSGPWDCCFYGSTI
jgi:hypothetical protein